MKTLNLQFGVATFQVQSEDWLEHRGKEIQKFEDAAQRQLHRLESDLFDVDLTVSAEYAPRDGEGDIVQITGESKTVEGKTLTHTVSRDTGSNQFWKGMALPFIGAATPFSKKARAQFNAGRTSLREESVDKFIIRAFNQIREEIELGRTD